MLATAGLIGRFREAMVPLLVCHPKYKATGTKDWANPQLPKNAENAIHTKVYYTRNMPTSA